MKKLFNLLSLLSLLSFLGCQKSETGTLNELKAHIVSGSDSTTGAAGYYIRLDSSGETVMPINLPSSFQSERGAISVKFVNTGKSAWSALPGHAAAQIVYLVTIRKL